MGAEFEEKEYEIPLNTQLLLGNSNLWTPGQVFEGNFGIDAAIEVLRSDFWEIVGMQYPLEGVILSHFKFGYVWRKVDKTRPLPTFKLNLFLQTKRPEGLRRRSDILRRKGIQTPYWRFSIKQHQQKLLSRLKAKLKNRAFVAYGCSAFHTYEDLYHHTENNSLVNNSTFVKVDKLDNHSKWIYDRAGSIGIAMSEPERIEDNYLFDEIDGSVENFTVENDDPLTNLRIIYNAINEICGELSEDNVIAREYIRRGQYFRNLNITISVSYFLSINLFLKLTSTNLFVIK